MPLSPAAHRLVAVVAGGMLGTVARIGIAELSPAGTFPWATLIVNVSGSLALGYLVIRFLHHAATAAVAFVGVGLLGSFTTFSAFVAEADRLGAADGVAYLAISIALGVGAARIGIAAGRVVESRSR